MYTFIIEVGDTVETLKLRDMSGNKLFPVGTHGIVDFLDNDGDNVFMKVSTTGGYWWYPVEFLKLVKKGED